MTNEVNLREGHKEVGEGYLLRTAKVIAGRIDEMLELPKGSVIKNISYKYNLNGPFKMELPFRGLSKIQIESIFDTHKSAMEYTACMLSDRNIVKKLDNFYYNGENKGAAMMQLIVDSLANKLQKDPIELNRYVLYNTYVDFSDEILNIDKEEIARTKNNFRILWSERYGLLVNDNLSAFSLLELELFDTGLTIAANSSEVKVADSDYTHTRMRNLKKDDLYSVVSETSPSPGIAYANGRLTLDHRSFYSVSKIKYIATGALYLGLSLNLNNINSHDETQCNVTTISLCFEAISAVILILGIFLQGNTKKQFTMRHEVGHILQTFETNSNVQRYGYMRVSDIEP